MTACGVLATGGGAVLRDANKQLLRERTHVIYLRVQPEEIFRRLKNEEILSSVIKYDNKLNILHTDVKALSPSVILANKENYTVSLYGISSQIKQYILPIFEKIPQLIFNEIIDKAQKVY